MSDPGSNGPENQDQNPQERGRPNFQVAIRLEWDDKPEVPIIYTNQVQVSHGGPEFFLLFGTMVPPSNPNEIPDALKIQPQVRLAIAREAMPGIVKALTDNLNRYQNARQQAEREGGPISG